MITIPENITIIMDILLIATQTVAHMIMMIKQITIPITAILVILIATRILQPRVKMINQKHPFGKI